MKVIFYQILNSMNRSVNGSVNESGDEFTLPPLKKRHERKSFATNTLKLINSRLQYYRRVLSQPEPTDEKKLSKRQIIKAKNEHNMKVRKLLTRAVANRYI